MSQPKPSETKTTVFRKTNGQYSLKMKTSRAIYSEISAQSGTFGFNLRSLEDEKKARMGILECVSHALVTPYDVLYEKEGDFTALYKYTIMITTGGAVIVAAPELEEGVIKSEITIQDEAIKKLIAGSLKKKAPKKKKEEETAAEGSKAKEGEAKDAAPAAAE